MCTEQTTEAARRYPLVIVAIIIFFNVVVLRTNSWAVDVDATSSLWLFR